MHIFDRITKGVDYYPLYDPILISYGTPDSQVSQILADREQSHSNLWSLLWFDARFDPSGTFFSSGPLFFPLQGLPADLTVA